MFILSLVIATLLALLVHELGHLIAARRLNIPCSELAIGLGKEFWSFKVGGIRISFRPIPLGSFVMLDGSLLKTRATHQQLLVHLGGVFMNIAFGVAAWGTNFGWINLLLAGGNLLPLYQHDGWKCGVVLLRKFIKEPRPSAEWAFTFSGGFVSLVVGWLVVRMFV
jgi:membrane-associated protease RseP (regulator of RpoE activity)